MPFQGEKAKNAGSVRPLRINQILTKYCFMQTHECRLKLDAAGEHLSISEGCDLCCIPIT
jgi:hypothetical protein